MMELTITGTETISPNDCKVKIWMQEHGEYWFLGSLSIHDKYLKKLCKDTKINYEDIINEAKQKGFLI